MTRGLALLVIACALLIVLMSRGGLAHDNPADWDWIGKGRLKNDKLELCCGRGVDCKEWPASMIKVSPTGYTFPNGHFVPANKVAPSQDELAHMCIWGGEVKCTFYPMGSM